MRYIFTAVLLASGILANAQFVDNSIEIAKDRISGSARYRAMGGAFTSLGGDLSSLKDNPAGASVFRSSQYAVSLATNRKVTTTSLSSSIHKQKNTNLNINHLGVVFLIPSNNSSNNWKNFSVSATYDKENDYDNKTVFQPFETQSGNTIYVNDGFIEETVGHKDVISGYLAANYDDKLFIGVGVAAKSLEYELANSYITLDEDSQNLVLEANENYFIEGSGVSLKAGLIYKPTHSLRLGVSYESPSWYKLDTPITYDIEDSSGDVVGYETIIESVNFNSAEKLNLGASIVVGKIGLLSADVVFKNNPAMKWKPSFIFMNTNKELISHSQKTIDYKLGGEVRLDKLSLRAGFRYEESPYKIDDLKADLKTYSLGMGYKFNNTNFDLSYDNSNNNYSTNLYDQTIGNIDQRIHNITATLSVNF